MSHISMLLQGTPSVSRLIGHDQPKLFQQKSSSCFGKYGECRKDLGVLSSVAGHWLVLHPKESSLNSEAYAGRKGVEDFPHIQNLGEFTKAELMAKIVMVRFDSTILLREKIDWRNQSLRCAIFTIRYLFKAGAKIILFSNWSVKSNLESLDSVSVADTLSSILQLKVLPVQCISWESLTTVEGFSKADILLFENLSKFKEETANCSTFSKILSSGVDIFVNDNFSQSHRILASTVGVTRFCGACVAGFEFEESLLHLKKIVKTKRKPYVAIVGGGDLFDKADCLHVLASVCDSLIFVGMMSFVIMHALGVAVPLTLVEHGARKQALEIVQFAVSRGIRLVYPQDFCCKNSSPPHQVAVFPAENIPEGWAPADLGPKSLENINSLLTESRKIIWIGAVKFNVSSQHTDGAFKLAKMLEKVIRNNCDVTIVGHTACEAIKQESSAVSTFSMFENASVVWEFLKGRKLPGVLALDRAYPFEINWEAVYCDTAQPLVVDIGSGNGLFLLEMAGRMGDLNFLGLESNEKLVKRCMESIDQLAMKNVYFVATNATSTFRPIVSSYPGELVLVSIQCPNPDFNKPEHRWRMLQRSLVEAVADLLAPHGKVFLQSDVEAVSRRMKEDFLKYGKGKLAVLYNEADSGTDSGGWLDENPFGVYSDWERHVIDRGDPMFRLMLSKATTS